MKKLFKIILPILVLTIGIGGFLALKATAPANIPKPTVEKKWPVTVSKIEIVDVRPDIRDFGIIISGSEIDIRSTISGKIIKMGPNFSKGAIIKKGEELATIDPFNFQLEVERKTATLNEVIVQLKGVKAEIEAESRLLDISRAQLKLRKRNLKRRQKLGRKGSSSRKSTDDAELAFNEASQEVASFKQSITRLKTRIAELNTKKTREDVELKLAKRDLQETKIIAPFNGFLTQKGASVGQYVDPSDRLGHLVKADDLEVQFKLTESDFASLFKGRGGVQLGDFDRRELIGKNIKVKWIVGDRSFEYNAIIRRLGAEIDVSTGGIAVFAQIINLRLDTPLRPGAFVEIVVPDRLYKGVWQVPDTAILGGKQIFSIKGDRLVAHDVVIVRRLGKIMYIRGNLADEQLIVTHIFPEISSNLRVAPR